MLRTRSAAPYREVTDSTARTAGSNLRGVTSDLTHSVGARTNPGRARVAKVRLGGQWVWAWHCRVCLDFDHTLAHRSAVGEALRHLLVDHGVR